MISNLEYKRQLFHLVFGIILALLIYYNLINAYILLGIVILGIIGSFLIKQKYISPMHWSVPVVHWFLKHCERDEDLHSFPGRASIYYLLGCIVTLAFFEKHIALAGIMILALGDSVSHVIGQFYGKYRHPLNSRKLIEGWIAGIIAGFLGAIIFVNGEEAFFASLIAMTAESIEWGVDKRILDDNFFIPIIAGVTITIIRLFHFF